MGGLHIQGQQQSIQFGRSIRITLLLMLSIFLIGWCQTCLLVYYYEKMNMLDY
jgi:hypothetical protein